MPPVIEAPRQPKPILLWIISGAACIAVTVMFYFAYQYYTLVENVHSTENSSSSAATSTVIEKVPKVSYEKTKITIAPTVAEPFAIKEIKNLKEVQRAFGVTFTSADLMNLEMHKFVIKNLLDTKLTPVSVGENSRELPELYQKIAGDSDYKVRTPANAPFISADVLMHIFSVQSVELMKETENKYLFPQVYATTKKLYDDVNVELAAASNVKKRKVLEKVRAYFAVPYALLSTAQKPLDAATYWATQDASTRSLEDMQKEFRAKDATVDTKENVITFVKQLQLDALSEKAVLADIELIYTTPPKSVPNIFAEEYQNIPGDIHFSVPFSLFAVRGSYTSSSLRRQYFRAVQWYQQIPFFTSSPELTTYAVHVGALLNKNPDVLSEYQSTSALLSQLVGDSDDLDGADYAHAFAVLGDTAYTKEKLLPFLDTVQPPARIKSLPAIYSAVDLVNRTQVIDATRGMRFYSQKFIPDSYWTGRLTQGDEVGDVNGQKLPHSASVLEVMSILGSHYAQSQLPTLSFYKTHKQAIDTRLAELMAESEKWGEDYWKSNQVTSILWSVSGLFTWQQENEIRLPAFMQSPRWGAKTLLTASGFWTELRHTNILYAKQSFAEKGGGGDDVCDTRKIPPPVYGYVEPQPEAYDRLYYAAQLLYKTYTDRGQELQNLPRLKEYIELLSIVREYTQLQLADTAFSESTIVKNVPLEKNPTCSQIFIDPTASIVRAGGASLQDADKKMVTALSRAEELRIGIADRMRAVMPLPVEGPILPIKDKRMAVVADIHTSEDGIVEEGTGVPRVIFVAVKDANGARLTTGFTYSHYEFLSKERLTDESWQQKFYSDKGGDYSVTYKPKTTWPRIPAWYTELLGTQ